MSREIQFDPNVYETNKSYLTWQNKTYVWYVPENKEHKRLIDKNFYIAEFEVNYYSKAFIRFYNAHTHQPAGISKINTVSNESGWHSFI